jgi:uncharacterized membrane protein
MILYVGPGLGGGVLAVIAGIFLTILSFFVAIFWIPLKRLYKFIANKLKRK